MQNLKLIKEWGKSMYKLMKNLDEKEFYLKSKKTQKNLNSLKSSSGVTLVALVITIIVLLILAGVTIALVVRR